MKIEEGLVDSALEHFELRFGPSLGAWDDLLPVALLSAPSPDTVHIQILVDSKDPAHVEAVEQTWESIRFYLQEKNKQNPWAYAKHHCGTFANSYACVRWGFFK